MTKKNEPVQPFRTYALITGAAGGMGRIYAEKLALRGYNLILADINPDGLAATAESVKSAVADEINSAADAIPSQPASGASQSAGGPDIILIPIDLAEKDAASRIFALTQEKNCEVEVLVNNAGLFFFDEFTSVSERKISTMMMVHNHTPVMLCRSFLPGMKERGKGYILNVSSLAAWMPWPGVGMYGNTKRFLKGFSRMLRVECAGSGVKVTAALFGAVDTPLYNLKPNLRKLARTLHVMIPPEKAAEKALKAVFRGRKSLMPGFINQVFRFFMIIVPDWLLVPVLNQVRKIWAKNRKK